MKDKPIVLDLFCGAGGLSRGFIDAGFSVKLGVDFDDAALKPFEANHEGATALKLDLFNLDNVNVIQDFFDKNNYKLDVLVGGPPCQGFSLAGPRQIDDSRNKLYQAMVMTARILRPRVVVLENVPGMIQLHGGLVKDKIIGQTIDVSSLPDGFYNVELSCEDKAGNRTNVSRNIHLDKARPSALVDILYPLNGEHKNGIFNIYGQTEVQPGNEISSVKLYIDDKLVKETPLSDAGFFKFEITPPTEEKTGEITGDGLNFLGKVSFFTSFFLGQPYKRSPFFAVIAKAK